MTRVALCAWATPRARRQDLLPVARRDQAVEGDLRRLADDAVGARPPRAAGHRPAERAVPGVEIEVAIARRADPRGAVRGHRAQAGPALGAAEIAPLGEEVADDVAHRVGGVPAEP